MSINDTKKMMPLDCEASLADIHRMTGLLRQSIEQTGIISKTGPL
jgi:hypothetical protein